MFSLYFDLMKKTLTTLLVSVAMAFSQGDIYPTETHYGGGVGFSTMYMILDSVPGESLLDELGFDVSKLSTRPLVFQGGEGLPRCPDLGGLAAMQVSAARMQATYIMYTYMRTEMERQDMTLQEIRFIPIQTRTA